MCEVPLQSHQDGQYLGSQIFPSSTHLTSRSSRTFSGRSRMASSGRTKSSTLPSCRYCRHRKGISGQMPPHPFLGLPPRVKHGHRVLTMPLRMQELSRDKPRVAVLPCLCPACTLPLVHTREQWRSTAVTSSGLRRRAAVSWMCGSRASGSLPLGCRVAMPMGPRMLARRLFSGKAQQGGVASGARTAPASPESSPSPLPQQFTPHQSRTDTSSAGQVHAEPAPHSPTRHTGTSVTPLQAPDDKLLHSTYCKGDGER